MISEKHRRAAVLFFTENLKKGKKTLYYIGKQEKPIHGA